jgi:L-fuculose-phosphate aldolase
MFPWTWALLTETVFNLGVVPVAPYATPGTQEVPNPLPLLPNPHAVLLANHGALTWGRSAMEAYYRMESLEGSAVILMNLGYLNRPGCLLKRREVEALLEARRRRGLLPAGFPYVPRTAARRETPSIRNS